MAFDDPVPKSISNGPRRPFVATVGGGGVGGGGGAEGRFFRANGAVLVPSNKSTVSARAALASGFVRANSFSASDPDLVAEKEEATAVFVVRADLAADPDPMPPGTESV